ncbi:MAG: helix-turn-helix transcriptional regulator [Eubacterium sp.]|nr:helix-turn-helix transcriptional regulator [Eubacterium sp.]
MNRSKYLPLTETTYLILVALIEPGHGYRIMQKVEELSDGNVRVAAGTMYGAIENLMKLKWIQSVPSNDARRKVYQITDDGMAILREETQRLRSMVSVADKNNI